MAVSRRLRFEILRRDNHTCRYCGASSPAVKLTVDHVVPSTLGGSDDPSNLVAACQDCNSGKSATPPGAPLVDDVSADQIRWANAMRATNVLYTRDMQRLMDCRTNFEDAWTGWQYGPEGNRQSIPLPPDWGRSVDQFMAAGYTIPVLLDCVRIAMESKVGVDQKWRYFCGVAWKRLTEMQEIAAQVATNWGDKPDQLIPEWAFE